MRQRWVGVVAIVGIPLIAIGTAVAATGHSDHIKNVVVHVGHKACPKTIVNGINDAGTVVGTDYCGHAKVFIRQKNGKTTTYSLPKPDAHFTLASNISSNGIIALVGSHTAKGSVTSYLLSKNGSLTALNDPSAAGNSTFVNSVNRHGVAVGNYCVDHKCKHELPFIYRNGSFKTFRLHHNQLLPSLNMITDSGSLAGFFYQRPGFARGFVKTGHKLRTYDAPHAGRKLGQGTFLTGTSSKRPGTLCGDVFTAHHHARGFVDVRGRQHLIDVHPSQKKAFTEVLACNSKGEFGGHALNVKKKYGAGFLGKVR